MNKKNQMISLEQVHYDDKMKHLDIMRSTLNDYANAVVRWKELKADGVENISFCQTDPELAEWTGRYNASKDILFLLGGGNLLDEYKEYETKNIAEAVEEAERLA